MNKILLYIICLLVSVFVNGQAKPSGVLMQSIDAFDEKTNKYVPYLPGSTGHRLFYYRDSLVIFQVPHFTFSSTDTSSLAGTEKLLYVVFIDLRSLSFYEYPEFSAQSRFTKKYKQADSMPIKYSWNFYSFAETQKFDSVHWVADTIINNIKYRRLQALYSQDYQNSPTTVQKQRHIMQLLTSCAQKGSIFHMSRSLEKRYNAGCPFEIAIDRIVSPKGVFKIELQYMRPLTKHENEIFDIWEKNARLYPVKNK
ncbi:hypothetical protein [Sediminibacterium ginsengisoli]|uniref:Uncharacterized protein n=1 Tax=Sediminibacterium ginsengisoli TaxID=413434 RepID=A0A1T4NHC9_9BACT|nr:hypothetical protein [Sediminibacterium ginsengisoli]SJZ78466.1 hypothetical protein SAMN04488132_104251 [Sediminibacterium ginsengisoli]